MASYLKVLIIQIGMFQRSINSVPTRRSSDLIGRAVQQECRVSFPLSAADLPPSLPLIKERILVIILLLHFLSLMLGSVLVLMLPLLVWLTPDLRIKKSFLKCN